MLCDVFYSYGVMRVIYICGAAWVYIYSPTSWVYAPTHIAVLHVHAPVELKYIKLTQLWT